MRKRKAAPTKRKPVGRRAAKAVKAPKAKPTKTKPVKGKAKVKKRPHLQLSNRVPDPVGALVGH